MKILKIFDNGGTTIDRYTVVTDWREGDYYMALYISEIPEHIQGGVSHWGMLHPTYLTHREPDDTEIQFSDLSEIAQKHVLRRMEE